MFLISPYSKTTKEFFRATTKADTTPNVWLLTSSLVISWIFAKSITNAANLGMAFGFVGGVAYATYYLSFLVAGFVIYQMRVKGGFESLHQFLSSKFGRPAVIFFSLLISFRLFNEVWSNTMVIGTYFGAKDSAPYFWAIIVFTVLTLAYTLKGGLRSSLLTDLIQMVLFGVLLFIILGIILPKKGNDIGAFVSSGEWTMAGGLNLLFVALIQAFSYPFHDPVLTDRGFIASPKVTLRSFIFATFIGAVCILLFSFVGIFAQMEGMEGQAPVEVSKMLGVAMMLIMNFIMVTSAASTLDSTFNSFSKMLVVDLGKKEQITVKRGRIAMVLVCILGTLPVFFSPEILSATTVSGTMVIGLAPIFVFWNAKVPKISFHLCVGTGVLFGLLLTLGMFPDNLIFFDGKYGDLLSVNIIGMIVCLVAFWLPAIMFRNGNTD
ncbi:MAG: sodium:solute symporter [Saprospiraceae bacterium]